MHVLMHLTVKQWRPSCTELRTALRRLVAVFELEIASDRQLGISLHTLDSALPLYDSLTGQRIGEELDR